MHSQTTQTRNILFFETVALYFRPYMSVSRRWRNMWTNELGYVTPCSLVDIYQRFGKTCSLRNEGRLLYAEDAGNVSSRALVAISQTTGRHMPKDRSLHSHRHKNPRSHEWIRFPEMGVLCCCLTDRWTSHVVSSAWFHLWCESTFRSKAERMNRSKLLTCEVLVICGHMFIC